MERIFVTKYETTNYEQMRRCRMAHLHGRMVDEHFKSGEDADVLISGYVKMVSPDLTCWPLRWTITIEQQSVELPVMALTD